MKAMNANRRFNSIARRIQRSWQWKKLWQIVILNLLALITVSCNLIADVVYGLVDPRVRIEGVNR